MSGGRGARAGGFTLVEVILASAVLSVGILSLLAILASSARVRQSAAETETAVRAATTVIERMRTTPWDRIHPTYAGATFAVPGLARPAPAAECGAVALFVNEKTIPASLGGPRDLNGTTDGAPDDVDASGTAGASAPPRFRILPVRLTINWRGVDGPRTMAFDYLLREGK